MPTGSAKFGLESFREIENSQERTGRSCQTCSLQGLRLVAAGLLITRVRKHLCFDWRYPMQVRTTLTTEAIAPRGGMDIFLRG